MNFLQKHFWSKYIHHSLNDGMSRLEHSVIGYMYAFETKRWYIYSFRTSWIYNTKRNQKPWMKRNFRKTKASKEINPKKKKKRIDHWQGWIIFHSGAYSNGLYTVLYLLGFHPIPNKLLISAEPCTLKKQKKKSIKGKRVTEKENFYLL